MAELYRRKCKCGRKFYSESKLARLCPLCKGEHKKVSWQKNNENCKKLIVENPKPMPVNISLPEMMALIRYYNAAYKTNYSYGQFVSQVYFGKIDLKKVIKNARLSAQKE